MIQWLTQDVLGSLLDESVFLNESLVWFKHKYILTAHFRHLYRRNNVIDKSTFDVSNYFQKAILLHFNRYRTHQSLYLNYKRLSQYFCDLNVCNTEIMILCVWLKRLWGWKDCEAVSFQTDDSCSLRFKCSNHTDVILRCRSKVEEWSRRIFVI